MKLGQLLILFAGGLVIASPTASGEGQIYKIFGAKPRVNREVQGPVTDEIQGVPAAPVDSMVWDGRGSRKIEGTFYLEADPVANTGSVIARWKDEHGSWEYRQSVFVHPHHIAGVRMSPTINDVEYIIKDPVVQNAYLHGDTGAGPPVMPTVFAYLACWGPAVVKLNGETFLNVYDGPLPNWMGHIMITHGVRNPDGTVRTVDDEIYSPAKADRGYTDPEDMEIHLTWHDARFPVTNNIPPDFSFFYHLVFENVVIQVGQLEEEDEK